MVKIILLLFRKQFSAASVKIIDRLMKDNERIHREWQQKYAQMEKDKYYWEDKWYNDFYLDGVQVSAHGLKGTVKDTDRPQQ